MAGSEQLEGRLRLHSARNDREYQPKRFNVGVDFGSTYSAATFVLMSTTTTKLEALVVKSIPFPKESSGENRKLSCEVPSLLRYEKHCIRWGWEVKRIEEQVDAPPGKVIEMFKLLLDDANYNDGTDPAGRNNIKSRILADLKVLGKSVSEILEDYLELLFGHIRGYMIDKGFYDPRDIVELICTVPAMWTPEATRKMVVAVGNAGKKSGLGFGNAIWLVSEPEAASTYVLTMNPHWDLQKGYTFLLCDAGGGTVDLITYTVTQSKPLRVQETVSGTGGLCGSNFLNSNCYEQTLRRLESATFSDGKERSQAMLEKMATDVTNHFDKFIKPTFLGDKDLHKRASVPRLVASLEHQFTDDFMVFTPHHLGSIFDPVISQVWQLIRSQLESVFDKNIVVERVCLVGGFGDSPRLQAFLQEMLKDWPMEHGLGAIELLVTDAPANAVSSGATLRSEDKTNGALRICRSSLGIVMRMPYNKSSAAHRNAQVTIDQCERKPYVDCLDWIFKLGDTLSASEIADPRALHRDVPIEDDSLTLSVTVHVSYTNRDSFYSISHTRNKDSRELEVVSFKLDMRKLQDKFEKMKIPKAARTRRPARKLPGVAFGQQRRSDRKRHPTAKAAESQAFSFLPRLNSNGDTTVIASTLEVLSLSNSSLDTGDEQLQQSPQLVDLLDDEVSPPPSADENSPSEWYYRVHYNFVMYVDGLVIKYKLDIPAANESIDGDVAIAHILSPGSS